MDNKNRHYPFCKDLISRNTYGILDGLFSCYTAKTKNKTSLSIARMPIFPPLLQTTLLVMLLVWASVTQAQGIVLKQANAPTRDGMIYLSATADIRLPDQVRTALDNGVRLTLEATIQVRKEDQVFLPSKRLVELKIKRWLSYHALTKRFTVDDKMLNKRESFSSFLRALTYLGKYRDIPVIKEEMVKGEENVFVRMRIALTREELPMPLRLKSYVTKEWYLFSDWYEWALP